MLSSGPAYSGELMSGAEIEAGLNDATVWYLPLGPDSARQYFHKNGETPYVDAKGSKTYGEWSVRGGKYCSIWPPSDQWVCYAMERGKSANGRDIIVFVSGGGGKRYEGVVKPGKHLDEAWKE